MHIHISVADLDQSAAFCRRLLNAEPSVPKPDPAKWVLDDPRVNCAISQHGAPTGLDHPGIQAEDAAELAEPKSRLDAAGPAALAETGTACCYARSDKHWVRGPPGIAREAYHTPDSVPSFSAPAAGAPESGCRVPPQRKVALIPRRPGRLDTRKPRRLHRRADPQAACRSATGGHRASGSREAAAIMTAPAGFHLTFLAPWGLIGIA